MVRIVGYMATIGYIPPEARKSVAVNLSVTPVIRKRIDAAAKREKITVSEWCRRAVNERLSSNGG